MKINRTCRIGRIFNYFTTYSNDHKDTLLAQLDSVEGRKGGKVLLTIHFIKAKLMLAFLRDRNNSRSIIQIVERLYLALDLNVLKIFSRSALQATALNSTIRKSWNSIPRAAKGCGYSIAIPVLLTKKGLRNATMNLSAVLFLKVQESLRKWVKKGYDPDTNPWDFSAVDAYR